ncbi:MAG: hypothetical protein EOO15_22200 [Chitinophagaceae bacterium]|nr:MAG: hypothetical protein EOO15_22200 [Chitinophagaceae bacterium]
MQELERANVRDVGSYIYALTRLSNTEPLQEAVVQEIASRGEFQERVPLELHQLQSNWRPQIEELVGNWVFGSPGNANTPLVQNFSDQLVRSFPDYSAYEIVGEGTMLPAEIWNALALTNGRDNWMLEFGWSD